MNPNQPTPAPSEKRCGLCDTILETHVGSRVVWFTGHTPKFCRQMTIARIRGLERALKDKDELWTRALRKHEEAVRAYLARHGLPDVPTVAEQAGLLKWRLLLDRSSVGQGLANIEENGIEAELERLDEELHPRSTRRRGK